MPVLFINYSNSQNNSFNIRDRFAQNFISRCPPIQEFNIQKVLHKGNHVDMAKIKDLFNITKKGIFYYLKQD